MRKSLFSKVAAAVVSFAIPIAMAGPAGAAVANDHSAHQADSRVVELAENYGVSEQQLANVDPQLVHNVAAELDKLPTDAMRSGKLDPNAVEPNLLDGLLGAVMALLEGLGLGDLLPELPETPEVPALPESSTKSMFGTPQQPGTLSKLETTSNHLTKFYQDKGQPTAADTEELEALWQQLGALLLQLASELGLDVPEAPEAPAVP